jgi:hypothetical protein
MPLEAIRCPLNRKAEAAWVVARFRIGNSGRRDCALNETEHVIGCRLTPVGKRSEAPWRPPSMTHCSSMDRSMAEHRIRRA